MHVNFISNSSSFVTMELYCIEKRDDLENAFELRLMLR